MEICVEQAREFLRLLNGNDESPVTFQVFYDPKNELKRPDLAKHWVATLDDSLEFLTWSQSQHCGVYVGVNESDGKGRENSNIVKYRCLFADFDGMEEPEWALMPHFVQKRDNTHGHAFWLVSDIVTAEQFKALQKRIALRHGTDNQVTDPARVVRLAGFIHYKNPSLPAKYEIVEDNTDGDHKYTVAEIEKAFALNAQQDAELNRWIESRGGILNGTGYELNERYINQFSNWLLNVAPPAVLGSGSHTVFKVAGYGHDHGIPLPEAQDIMWECYNPRCQPPWKNEDKAQFTDIIERAYLYATSAAGCKTAVAGFSSNGNIPEPVNGWEENAKLKRQDNKSPIAAPTVSEALHNVDHDGRLNETEASIALSQLNNKSSHYDLARAIDGTLWCGNRLIRCEKIFYIYDGKIWSDISDEVIKSQIQRFYSTFKPNDSLVRGVLASLCDLVNVPRASVENGTWIDGCGRNGDNVVIYKNGIVDLSVNNPVLEPHNRNFFSFNMRGYNYNPTAKCPTWLSFLDSIWGSDDDLKKQLQEFAGYLLTDSVLLQKFAVFMGKSRGGKGVLTNVFRKLVGEDNTVAATLSNLTKDSTLHSMSSSSLTLVPDAHNVNFNSRDAVLSNFKAITGGDPMNYHVMYKGSQTSIIKTRFILSTNNMPDFTDSSGALANRMLVFPFTRSFAGKENPNLLNELITEIEGIAVWALEGLARLRKNDGKFTEAESGLVEKEEIREDMFPLARYVNSMCELSDSFECSTETLFAGYKLWCTLTGVKSPYTEIQFSKVLRCSELQLTKSKVKVAGKESRGFKGIKLNLESMSKLNLGVNFSPVI